MAQSLTRNRKATESSKKKSNAGGRAGNLTRRKAPVAKREKNDESVGRRKGSDHMPTKGRKKTKKKKANKSTKAKEKSKQKPAWSIPQLNIYFYFVTKELPVYRKTIRRGHQDAHEISMYRSGYMAKKYKKAGEAKGWRKERNLRRIQSKQGATPVVSKHAAERLAERGPRTLPIVRRSIAESHPSNCNANEGCVSDHHFREIVVTFLPADQLQDYAFAKKALQELYVERVRSKKLANRLSLPRQRLLPEHDNILQTCKETIKKNDLECYRHKIEKGTYKSGCLPCDSHFTLQPERSTRKIIEAWLDRLADESRMTDKKQTNEKGRSTTATKKNRVYDTVALKSEDKRKKKKKKKGFLNKKFNGLNTAFMCA